MDVKLLVVATCPHQDAAAALLRQALDDIGLRQVSFPTRVIHDLQEADELGLAGSPTFLVDGVDPFPQLGSPGPSLACRLGQPDLPALRQALKEAAARSRRSTVDR